ncbi:hypothetical protein ABKN59_006341 [Abortiporus biennis]
MISAIHIASMQLRSCGWLSGMDAFHDPAGFRTDKKAAGISQKHFSRAGSGCTRLFYSHYGRVFEICSTS